MVLSTSWAQIFVALCLTKEVFLESWFQVLPSLFIDRQTDRPLLAGKEPASCPHHPVMEVPLAQLAARVGKRVSTGLYFALD